ncbi:MAG TPA: hypothetical protein PLI18_08190 [Pirellulaceae bacterium]|nr:hypothetical protein [Pirellulaceae bacterium]
MISTCGTSLLTNNADAATRSLLNQVANRTLASVSGEELERLTSRIAECRERLAAADLLQGRALSAELNGVFGYYDDRPLGHPADRHVLLHTDTLLGEETAGLLHGCLIRFGLSTTLQTFPGLRTDTLLNFQESVVSLIGWCQEELPGYRASGFRIVFNLTGGFKSIQGWMQTLGMIHADEIVYIFESANELLRIPRLPVAFEVGTKQVLRNHLPFFRRLATSHAVPWSAELRDIPEAFFVRMDDEVGFSPWGKLVWEQGRADLYGEQLLDPPSRRLRFSDRFRRAAAALAHDRLVILNERIDDLTRYLATGENLRRLDFKPLRGNPLPNSTHEFDAWADQAAWRGFAHFDGNVLVLDDLGVGLH